MRIRCWGARGSIPVSGQEYVAYGGDTTCMEVRTLDDEIIIIDAGTGIRALGNALLNEGRFAYGMFFTHGHWDHIMGFPFFKPLHNPQTRITVYGCPFARDSVKDVLAPSMSPPSFPVNIDEIKASVSYTDISCGCFDFKNLEVCTIALSHPNQGMGYKFSENGKTFVFLTDNELSYRHEGGRSYGDYVAFVRGADVLMHDAEYTEEEYAEKKTWGHSTYAEALQLAFDAGVKQLVLFHHNQDRSDSALDAIVSDCRRVAGLRSSELEVSGARQGMEIDLS